MSVKLNYILTHQFKHVFGYSKEPSHLDASFEYPKGMFWMRNKRNSFPIHTLIWSPVLHSYLVGLEAKIMA